MSGARGSTISAVVNTLDEERRLAFALRSVRPWVDEIVVVDMASTDRTVEVARAFGAQVASHPRTGFVEPARAFACAQATGDWVLVLDADEVVPPELARCLRALADADRTDVVRVARVNHILGAPVLHSGWNPERDRQVRFWRRGAVDLPERIHGHPVPRAGMRLVDLPFAGGKAIVHLSHVDVAALLDKLNAYTSVEAEQAFARGEHAGTLRALRAAGREWLARYLRHGGFRDGWRGFYLALLMAGYRVASAAKLAERAEVGTAADVERRYARVAEAILARYDDAPVRAATPARAPGDAADPGGGKLGQG
jgi:glycosyltransferase involved in cell wall biosynthesis